jgi:hypothetical protein
MPITSKTLIKLANQSTSTEPDRKRWRIDGVDALGRGYVHGPFSGTQAEADAVLSTVVWNLTKADKDELLDWVKNRNTVASFDYTNRDITELDGEEYIFQWFAESPGNDAILVAWWMDSINTGKFNSIRDRIGYTGDQGADITSRFSFMVTVEPWYEFIVEAL